MSDSLFGADAMKKIAKILLVLMLLIYIDYSFAGSVKLSEASLTSLQAGESLYNGNNSASTGSFGRTNIPVDIKALSEGLALLSKNSDGSASSVNYIAQAYAYVKSEVEPEFRFGLSKGGYGAYLDKSGTPFDQIQLLHDILSVQGISSTYILGRATLTASQFADWTGITTAKEACKLFANGGIPAEINGVSPADCNLTGTLSSVTFLHIWLRVIESGITFNLDPSFKKITYKSPIDLVNATGYSRVNLISAVTTGGSNSSSALNVVGLTNYLDLLANNYYQNIKTNYSTGSILDVAGGGEIAQKEFSPTSNDLNNLLYVSNQITEKQSIPDNLRTKLSIGFRDFSAPAADTTFFVPSESHSDGSFAISWNSRTGGVFVYETTSGQKTQVGYSASGQGGSYSTKRTVNGVYSFELWECYSGPCTRINSKNVTVKIGYEPPPPKPAYLELSFFADTTYGGVVSFEPEYHPNYPMSYGNTCYFGFGSTKFNGDFGGQVKIEVNHPYLSANAEGTAGAYQDSESVFSLDCSLPLIVAQSYGNTNGGLVRSYDEKIAEAHFSIEKPAPYGGARVVSDVVNGWKKINSASAMFFHEQSRRVKFVSGITKNLIESHHTIGLVTQAPLVMINSGDRNVTNQGIQFSLDIAMSSAPQVATTYSRTAIGRSLSWLLSSLEGEVAQHESGGPFAFSTANRFSWGITQPLASNVIFNNYSPNSTIPSIRSHIFQSSGSNTYTQGLDSFAQTIASYTLGKAQSFNSRGYNVTLPNLAIMGPGELYWNATPNSVAGFNGSTSTTCCSYSAFVGSQYGSALYAENTQTGDFQHVMVDFLGTSYGGGAGARAPSFDAGKLEAPKVDNRQKIEHGVQKATGDVSYKFGSIISVGGEFPYGLSADISVKTKKTQPEITNSLTYDSTGSWARLERNFEVNEVGSANFSSNSLNFLGQRNPLEGSTAIAAVISLLDISSSTEVKTPLMSALILNWLSQKADENTLNVTSSRGSQEFVRHVDGKYYAKPGVAESVTVSPTAAQLVTVSYSNEPCGQSFGGTPIIPLPPNPNNYDWMISGRVKVVSANIIRTLKNGDKESYAPRYYKASRWDCGPTNPWHPLVKFDNNKGVTVSYNYDSFKQLIKINNSLGRELIFTPSGDYNSGYTLTVTDQTGRQAVVQEDIANSNVIVTNADSKKWIAKISEAQGTNKAPLNGHVLAAIYSPSDSENPMIRYSYNSLWQVNSLDLRNKVTGDNQYWNKAYQWGYLTGYANVEIDSANSKISDFFDNDGNLVYQRSPSSIQTISSYDSWNRVIDRRVYASNIILGAIPNANGLWPADASGYTNYNNSYLKRSAYINYDAQSNAQLEKLYPKAGSSSSILNIGRTFEAFNSELKTETFRYADGYPAVISITNTYNPANGLLTKSLSAAGLLTEYKTYNAIGLPTLITEGSSSAIVRRKVIEYDNGSLSYGNLTKFTTTDLNSTAATSVVVGASYTTTNDEIRGDIRSVTDPRGYLTTASYDNSHHIIDMTAPLGTGAKYDYDDNGRLYQIRSKDGKGNFAVTTAALNPLGWMTGLKDPSNNWQYFTYDARGLLAQSEDGVARITKYNYDANGKLTCEQNGVGTSLLRSYKILGYNELGQLVSSNPAKSDPNNDCQINNTTYQTTLIYDDYGQSDTTIYPDGTYERSIYHLDGSGNVSTKRTRRGDSIGFTYDFANRVYTKTYPGSGTTTYYYNVFSLPTDTTQAGGVNSVLSLGYDFLGRLTSSTQNGRTVAMDYDKSNNRSYVQWPDGYRVTYGTYDSSNRITTITDSFNKQLASYSYDINYDPSYANGSRTILTYGNGKTSYFDYKLDGDLKALTHNIGAPVAYGYEYTAAHQLYTESLSNRIYQWIPQTAASSYSINNLDQYTDVDVGQGGVVFNYDNSGNLIKSNKGTFDYDAENKLISAVIGSNGPLGALVVNYSYDPNGRRTQKSVIQNGITNSTQYLSEGDNEIAEYVGAAATPFKRFIYGAGVDNIIAMQDVATNTYTYAHRNHQGSVIAASDAAGNVNNNNIYTYSAYGEPNTAANTGSLGFPYRYTGRRIDVETGLYYYRARYYEPQLGRFLQTDPIGYKDNMNLYAYTGNDPMNKTDPAGTSEESRRGRVMRELVKAIVKPKGAIARSLKNAEATEKAETAMLAGDKKAAAEAIKEIGSKRGPKTDGEGPHNEKIKEIGDRATANGDKVVAGGGKEAEKLIATPGGIKSGRRPDVVIEDGKTGELGGVNVGRVKADGTPIKREQDALDDLNKFSDIPTTFEAYFPLK